MPRLIVNADDFGYTRGINQSIAALHSLGALTSATLMARGMALNDALARLDAAAVSGGASLRVGCHVVLVDGTPAASPSTIASLLAPGSSAAPTQPRFRPTLGMFVGDLLRGRIREHEMETEALAQIRSLQARGIHVTHLDTHKHTHMFPGVLRPLLRAAMQCGVKAIRNPFEPAWSIAAAAGAPLLRRAEVGLLTLLRPSFMRLLAEAGMVTTDGALGVLATGTLSAAGLERLLAAALKHGSDAGPGATWELVCHPGFCDADLAGQPTRLQGSREQEHAALLAALPLLQRFDLIDFSRVGQNPAVILR